MQCALRTRIGDAMVKCDKSDFISAEGAQNKNPPI